MIAAFLLALAALPPALEKQILASFAPGDAPRGLSLLLEVQGDRARVLVLCGLGAQPRPLIARVSARGELQGDPVEIASGLSGRSDCGTATASAPFAVRRKGANPQRGVVLSFAAGGAPFLAVAISLQPAVLTWTDAPGAGITLRNAKGETSFCERQRDGAWAVVSWSAEAGEWAPSGACRP